MPYSTIVRREADGGWQVRRVARERTPLKRLISYKIQEQKRLLEARILRWMPKGMQDRNLLKRYQGIMGKTGVAPEVIPGGAEAAIGEATKA
jgi:hypothetical protein